MSDPVSYQKRITELETEVARLQEALNIVKEAHRRVCPGGEWTFPVTLKPSEVAEVISALSLPPPEQETP